METINKNIIVKMPSSLRRAGAYVSQRVRIMQGKHKECNEKIDGLCHRNVYVRFYDSKVDIVIRVCLPYHVMVDFEDFRKNHWDIIINMPMMLMKFSVM